MKKIIGLLLSVFLLSAIALADIPPNGGKVKPPKPSPTPKVQPENEMQGRLFIRVKSDVTEPTLIIKKSTLSQLRAAIDQADDEQNNKTLATTNGLSRTQTIVSGLFFSMAFVFGGVFVFRKGKPKLVVSLFVLAVLSAGAGIVWANTPPPFAVDLTSKIFSPTTYAYGWASGPIKIKISDNPADYYDFTLQIPDAEKKVKTDE